MQRIIKQTLVTFLLLSFITPLFANPIELFSARTASTTTKTRFVFVLSDLVKYQVFSLHNPDRLVVDLPDTQLDTNLHNLNLQNSSVKEIRTGNENQATLRLVLDLKNSVTPTSFILPPSPKEQTRLVIDLINRQPVTTDTENTKDSQNTTTTAPTSENTSDNSSLPSPLLTVSSSTRHPERHIIVVIDPGHGGKDPGASGPHGIKEKNVVLTIARDLQTQLNQIPGVQATLTRTGDYFIPLRGRLDIARKDKADLFVAIHADAYINDSSQGASVFALSEHGATSEAARWLADKENYSELGGVQDFSDKGYIVRSVLLDLSQTVTITQSLQMGRCILNSLGQITPLHHNAVEQAGFMVLKSPDIPSLLVETGFITNSNEEFRLSNMSYQEKMAEAIAQGIEKYFWRNPPSGTLFAAKQGSTKG